MGDGDILHRYLNHLRAFYFRPIWVAPFYAFEPDMVDGRIGAQGLARQLKRAFVLAPRRRTNIFDA